eukprot:Skav222401  [mRNA]  locus=scaffold4422:329730:331385:+ [translate_table: standard]
MHALRQKAAFAQLHQLFRSACASNVVWNLGMQALCQGNGSMYESLKPVSKVDVFISHSWSCPAWMKALAVCHYLNLDLAFGSTCLAAVLAVFVLRLNAGSFSAIAQQSQNVLFCSLICWPVVAFLIPFFFGHTVSRKSFWLDRVCVDQDKKDVKAQILDAIPAFVAQSSQMLVLWDATYFERLWCNYELAVHAKTYASEDATQLIPIWMPLWTMCWFCVSVLSSSLNVGQQSPQLDAESRSSLFSSVLDAFYVPSYVYLLASLPFSYFCSQKLSSHKTMLDQMTHFEFRNAKCAVDSDRKLIEKQVLQLFDEALEPPLQISFCGGSLDCCTETFDDQAPLISSEDMEQIRHITSYPLPDEVIESFNAYVRGPLCDIVVKSVGREPYISLKLCMVVSFPLWLLGLVLVLGCDGRSDCETSAAYSNFSSVSEYMIANAAIYLVLQPLVNVLGLPLMLQANHLIAGFFGDSYHTLQLVLGWFVSGLILKLSDDLWFAMRAMLVVVVTKYSATWLACLILAVLLELVLLWVLFLKESPLQQRQQQCKHRALLRQG